LIRRFSFVIILLTIWAALAALAVGCAWQLELSSAVIAWSVAAAIACTIGAFLISRQPLGIATLGGRFGSAVVRWGFRAGHGRLTMAAMISWLIWFSLGAATIAAIKFPTHLPILTAWTGDIIGLFYVIGVMLTNVSGRIPASLVKVVAGILGLIAGSMFLWFRAGSDQARAIALAVAGGPPLLVGAIYGFVLTTGLLSGRFRNR
jgi:hypothetical protein